jgi:hypothetical protein
VGMFFDFVVGTYCVCVCDGNIRVKRNCTFITEWWVGEHTEQPKNFIGTKTWHRGKREWSGMPRTRAFLELVVFYWLRTCEFL